MFEFISKYAKKLKYKCFFEFMLSRNVNNGIKIANLIAKRKSGRIKLEISDGCHIVLTTDTTFGLMREILECKANPSTTFLSACYEVCDTPKFKCVEDLNETSDVIELCCDIGKWHVIKERGSICIIEKTYDIVASKIDIRLDTQYLR